MYDASIEAIELPGGDRDTENGTSDVGGSHHRSSEADSCIRFIEIEH